MKKVLLISPSPDLAGGISKWTKHILNYFQNVEHGINLQLLPVDSIYIGNHSKNSLFKRFKRGFSLYIGVIIEVYKLINKNKFDFIQISSSSSISLIKDLLILKIAHFKKVKPIVHFHFGRIPELSLQENWEWKLLKKVINLSYKTVVIDQFSLKILVDLGFKNVFYIPNPIGNQIINWVESYQSIERNNSDIVFVGQLIQNKGIFELVEACREIPNIRLKMFGVSNDIIEEDLKKIAGQNNTWLEIYGETDYETVIKNMLSAGVFVLPTYTEGFPNVILESMACACPIITTNVGAIPEMLNSQSITEMCGIMIEPRNVEQLKNAIHIMLDDRKFAIECGQNAKNRVLNNYAVNTVANQWIKLWN